MWEDDERRVIQECVDVITKHVGVRPTGWMGAGAAETNVTPDLLKEVRLYASARLAGRRSADLDEHAVGPAAVGALSDGAQRRRHAGAARPHRTRIRRHDRRPVRRTARASEKQPLVFSLSLHGFILGQPFRLRPLRQAIKHCVQHKHADQIWFTRAGEICEVLLQHGAGDHPRQLRIAHECQHHRPNATTNLAAGDARDGSLGLSRCHHQACAHHRFRRAGDDRMRHLQSRMDAGEGQRLRYPSGHRRNSSESEKGIRQSHLHRADLRPRRSDRRRARSARSSTSNSGRTGAGTSSAATWERSRKTFPTCG